MCIASIQGRFERIASNVSHVSFAKVGIGVTASRAYSRVPPMCMRRVSPELRTALPVRRLTRANSSPAGVVYLQRTNVDARSHFYFRGRCHHVNIQYTCDPSVGRSCLGCCRSRVFVIVIVCVCDRGDVERVLGSCEGAMDCDQRPRSFGCRPGTFL